MPLVLAGVARFCRAFAPAANASVRIHRPEPRVGRVNLRQRRISGGVPFKVSCAIEIEKREDLWYNKMSTNRDLQVRLMRIAEVTENKKQYLDLLLLADEQEDMVDRYLYKGKMYVLDDDGVKCECVVTDEGNGILEIKNIATVPPFQRKGYAKALIEFLVEKYRRQFSILQVGTGDSPLTIPFYEKCGFVRSHTVPNFFTDHYDHPIYECGVHLVDMVYLQRPL